MASARTPMYRVLDIDLRVRPAIGLIQMPGWRLGVGGELAFIVSCSHLRVHASSPAPC